MNMNGFVIFSDIKGYSKLKESELRNFIALLEGLGPVLKKFQEASVVWNTWGDALFAVFADGRPAVELALAYRDYFQSYPYQESGLRRLTPRIAGHFGEFIVFDDPLAGGRQNAIGSHINRAARIEPITRPGEIFVSKDFKERIEGLPEAIPGIAFGLLGTVKLAKAFGDVEAYRLYPAKERRSQQIDALTRLDLGPVLPEPHEMSRQEEQTIEAFKAVGGVAELEAMLATARFSGDNSTFLVSLAKICKEKGAYEKALEFLDQAQQATLIADGIVVHPHRHELKTVKLRANCLTRIGRYDEAAEIMYGMWRSGHTDSDTLSMLAAQYKRRALYGADGSLLNPKEINSDLLKRARSIYIEAFRMDISNFYPLINAAYIYSFPPIADRAYTTKLSKYIIEAFSPEDETRDWWLSSTLAEAEMLQHCTDDALDMFKSALKVCRPDSFMVSSTVQQIEIYAQLTGAYEDTGVREILRTLREG